jgi:hypothetical protein
MSMGNLLPRKALLRDEMATDRTDGALDQFRVTTEGDRPEAPGMDHLTVVPENANTDE